MGFDFVNTRAANVTGPQSVLSASVSYPTLNSNIFVASMTLQGVTGSSGSLIVRNGLIVGEVNLSSSTQPY